MRGRGGEFKAKQTYLGIEGRREVGGWGEGGLLENEQGRTRRGGGLKTYGRYIFKKIVFQDVSKQ